MKTTHLLIVLNLLIYTAMLGVTHGAELRNFSTGTLVDFGCLDSALVRSGEWWRLVTMMFIHLTPLHLAMNLLALWQAGDLVEQHYGRGRFVALYLVAGLAGSAASLAWRWSSPVTSAGASGAISGLVGAGVVAGHLLGGPEGIRIRNTMLRWAFLIVAFGLAAGSDNAAHAGGFVGGCATAWLLDTRGRKRGAQSLGLESLALIALVGVTFGLAGRAQHKQIAVEDAVRAGVEHGRAGRATEAAVEYRKALALDPRNAIARFDLALSLLRLDDYAAAAAEARLATTLDPTMTDAWYVLAAALEGTGDRPGADAAFKKFVALGGKLESPDAGARD